MSRAYRTIALPDQSLELRVALSETDPQRIVTVDCPLRNPEVISCPLRGPRGGPMAMFSRTRTSFVPLAACFAVVLTGLAGAIRGGAQTPSPALLVLEKSDEKLAIVDPNTLKIVGRVPSGGAPHEVVASDDGKFAYISNYASQQVGQLKTLGVVDLTAQKALTPVDLGALRAPHGLVFGDGKE